MPDDLHLPPAEHTITVPRTARYYTLGPSKGATGLWIACHGQGQLARRFIRHFAPIDDGSRLVVAPEAHSRYYLDPVAQQVGEAAPRIGASWMTREFREQEMTDYVGYIERVVGDVLPRCAASPRIVAFGFSQGAATISRWVASTSTRVDELVLWGGGLPPEIELASWATSMQGVPLTYVVGDDDEYITPKIVARELARVSAHSVPHRIVRFAGGHEIDPAALLSVVRV